MPKFRASILLLILLLAGSGCSPTASSTSTPPAELPPTPYPDTPAPAAIDAPLVEAPGLVTIHFLNELDGWGVTETQIVRTNDGGITWYNITPQEITEAGYKVNLSILNNDTVWAQSPDFANYPNSGFLFHTSNGGLTWTKTSTPFSTADITFLDDNNGWALADLGAGAGSNAVAVYQTTDAGASWKQTYINDPNDANAKDSLPLGGIKNGLTPLNMQTAWVTGVTYSSGSAYLYRTDNAGVDWALVTSLPLPAEAQTAELGSDQIEFVTAQDAFMTVHVAGADLKTAVYVSHDSGNTWSLTPTLIPNGRAADFVSATDGVIYNGEQFYVTHDAARTWSIIPPNVAFGDTFTMMDFVNAFSGWVITLDAANQRALYRTTDGGATWSPVIP